MFKKDPSLRSHEVVDGMDKGGPRAHLRNVGLLKEELKKPFIAIVNTYNEMHPGHFHLNELVGHIRDGVYAAGSGIGRGINQQPGLLYSLCPS